MKRLEICCGSIEDVHAVSSFEIDSIELNSALSLGGLTPSLATLSVSKEITEIPIFCMIRNIPGGFVYSELDFQVMLQDAKELLENKANGIVFGCLTSEMKINVKQTQQLIDLAHHYQALAIFHRAFDLLENQTEAYQQLIEMGIDRVLTSGGQPKAMMSILRLNELISIDAHKLIVGSGLNPSNIHDFLRDCNANYIHASCSHLVERINGNQRVNYDYIEKNKTIRVNPQCVSAMLKAIK